jgi:hypothetical protein
LSDPLNVLHHLGDDFGDRRLGVEAARARMAEALRALAGVCDTLAFQLGFNWKGDRTQPLFANGTKAEIVDFVQRAAAGVWDVEAAAIARGASDYTPLRPGNLGRFDEMGEFANRPLFVMRARRGRMA